MRAAYSEIDEAANEPHRVFLPDAMESLKAADPLDDLDKVSRRRGRGKSTQTLAFINAMIQILARIQPASVRAVCYQLFIHELISSMARRFTNKVSVHLTWAREHGRVPWRWVVDEAREAECVSAWDSLADYADTSRSPRAMTIQIRLTGRTPTQGTSTFNRFA